MQISSPWSGWIDEDAVIRIVTSGMNRLSGSGIRRGLHICYSQEESFRGCKHQQGRNKFAQSNGQLDLVFSFLGQ